MFFIFVSGVKPDLTIKVVICTALCCLVCVCDLSFGMFLI